MMTSHASQEYVSPPCRHHAFSRDKPKSVCVGGVTGGSTNVSVRQRPVRQRMKSFRQRLINNLLVYLIGNNAAEGVNCFFSIC